MVRPTTLGKREFMSNGDKKKYKELLDQLCDASNLDRKIGELFLTEIKLSTDEANKHLRERAILLGLM